MNYTKHLARPLTNDEVDYNLDSLAARLKHAGADNMSVILRRDLTRPLTNREMDNNFQQLDLATNRLLYGDGPYPSLDLQFAGATMLDPRTDFTRGSEATGWVNGQLKTFGINEPRFVTDPSTGYSGLLLEPFASTNLLNWSGDMMSTVWGTITVGRTPGQLDSSGGYSAVEVLGGLGDGSNVVQSVYSVPEAGRYTATAVVKRVEGRNATLDFLLRNGSTATNFTVQKVNLEDGVVVSGDAQVSALPNGFWKVVWTSSASDVVNAGDDLRLYVGATGSIANKEDFGIIVDYAQLESGTKATSYIPAGDSQVTRAGDYFTLPVGDWYRPDRGTLLVDCMILSGSPLGGRAVRLGGGGNRFISVLDSDAIITRRRGAMANGGTVVAVSTPSDHIPFGNRMIGAISWKGSDFVVAVNGETSDTSSQPNGYPGVTELKLSTLVNGTWTSSENTPSAIIRRVAYYPERLTDAQLAALTEVSE